MEPLLSGHHFCIRDFQEGWPLIRGRNQYINVYIYIDDCQVAFLEGQSLKRGSTMYPGKFV